MFLLIIIAVIIFLAIPFIDGFTGKYKHAAKYGVKYSDATTPDELEETEEQNDPIKEEKREILDNALVKYNRLLTLLEYQYQNETDQKKKAGILSKQITILEKLNRAVDKREKLE